MGSLTIEAGKGVDVSPIITNRNQLGYMVNFPSNISKFSAYIPKGVNKRDCEDKKKSKRENNGLGGKSETEKIRRGRAGRWS